MRRAKNRHHEGIVKAIFMIIVVLVVAVKVIPLLGGAALLFLYLFRKQI
jgi:hypothetical protein